MYDELYSAWRLEMENAELSSLPPDFYVRLADYLRRIKEENRMTERSRRWATLETVAAEKLGGTRDKTPRNLAGGERWHT